MKHNILTVVLAVFIGVSLFGCSGGGGSSDTPGPEQKDPVSLVSITLDPASAAIDIGATRQFTATGTYSDGSTKDVTSGADWASSDPKVATIGPDGLASGVTDGAATLSASLDGMSGSASLVVNEAVTPPVTLTSITLDPANAAIALGNGQQFTATGHYSNGANQDITESVTSWSSSDTGVATVNTTGHAMSVAMGHAKIMAELEGIIGEAGLVVSEPILRSIDITPQNPSVAVGDTPQFTATGTYSDGSTRDLSSSVEWSSEYEVVATIDENGLATALARGETHITAETGDFSDTALLIVGRGDLVTITIEPVNPSVEVSGEIDFTAIGRYEDDSEEDITPFVTWESSNESVASVENGNAQGLQEGFSIIKATASDGAISGETAISVYEEGTVVYDNGASNATSTGSWADSSADGAWGAESLVTKNEGTYTWSFTPEVTGDYDVFLWWTEFETRKFDVPIEIIHEGGTSTVSVDQRTDGSQWNFIGRYPFTAGLTYTVTVIAEYSEYSTCADAVKFALVPPVTTPIADFTASPTSGIIGTIVEFFEDCIGTIIAWLWDFGDGTTSTEQNPQHQYTAEGSYTVSLTVTDATGTDTKTRPNYINIFTEQEKIYVCDGFDGGAPIWSQVVDMLRSLGAIELDGTWVYQNPDTGRTHFIYEVTTPAGMEAALKEEEAHVIFNGHSNYGLGASFTYTDQEQAQVRYVDDDRFVKISTDMVSVSLEGLIFSQAYPNLKPIYKDGASAIMPYDFGDSRGNPPFNYLITYKVPGDDTPYFIERPDGTPIDRFEGTGKPAWDWPHGEGIPPDPDDPEERLYYITNPAPEYNHFSCVGTWNYAITPLDAYYSYNYQYRSAGGTGENTATWTFVIAVPGYYDVQASWFYDTINATNAQYTIVHADGTTVVEADQRTAPDGTALRTRTWNSLGQYYFETGAYTVTLRDGANGKIIADSIILYNVDDTTVRRIRVDNTNLYKSHFTGGYYGSGTILNMEGRTIPEEELLYKRMFYSSCFSGRYFLGKFHRGQMFFTLEHTGGWDNPVPEYLRRYLLGQSDQEILAWIKAEVPIYDYYDFDQIPPSMR